MIEFEKKGKEFLYYNKDFNEYSDLALGILARFIPTRISIAYVDCSKKAKKVSNLFENLSLSSSFLKILPHIKLEFFRIESETKISKSLIPQVEFYSTSLERMVDDLKEFDMVIIDGVDEESPLKNYLSSLVSYRKASQDIIIITIAKKTYDFLKKDISSSYVISTTNQPFVTKNQHVQSIVSNNDEHTYTLYGKLLREFMNKEDVKLISFRHDNQTLPEFQFFMALKQWRRVAQLYGTFDFAYNQTKSSSQNDDVSNTFSILKTALKYPSVVGAENVLNSEEKLIVELANYLSTKKNYNLLVSGNEDKSSVLPQNSISTQIF